MDAFKEKKMK